MRGLSRESPHLARGAALAEIQRFAVCLLLTEETASLSPLLFEVLEGLRAVSGQSTRLAWAVERYPELTETRSRLIAARKALNDLGVAAPAETSELEAWRRELLTLAEHRNALERELRASLYERGEIAESPTCGDVAAGLEPDAGTRQLPALPASLRLRLRDRGVEPSRRSLLAFVLEPDGSVRRVELGPSGAIEELALRWRAQLGRPVERGIGSTAETTETTEDQVGEELRKHLLDPCLRLLGEKPPRTLHLILDDFLHLIPIDALPWDETGRLGEVSSVRIEVSVKRLAAEQPPPVAEGVLIALGGVDFEALKGTPDAGRQDSPSPSVRSGLPDEFEPLLQTRLEVETVGLLHEEYLGTSPRVLTRKEASKPALAELAPAARFLHVATHGWFAPETILSMRDSPAEENDAFARADRTLRGFAPETLCGLALAGANAGSAGILTAEELATLDLSNCELAVLSACETNVGIRRAGQGIQSLQTALHAAGARTAITSLWRVDDAATRRLMELFYTKLWKDGLGKADALWRAKQALRGEGHPIRDWAGWVLTGDPD